MTHKNIKRFQIEVQFKDDSDMIRLRAQYESLLSHDMTNKGYVKVLDIDPAFSVEFNGETWKFLMSIHGIYVGKRKAKGYSGWSQGKLIPKVTHQVISSL
jgi:hypothetical protein